MKDKYIVLIVGKSGSGKSTICDRLTEQYGLKQVKSYTTRPRRGDGDNSHIFVNDEKFAKLENKCAYTIYDNRKYCATTEQVDNADLYIIDVDGVEYFLSHYNGRKIPMVVYIETSKNVRKERMMQRGDAEYKVMNRLRYDKTHFDNADEYAIKTYQNETEEDLDKIVESIYNVFFYEG